MTGEKVPRLQLHHCQPLHSSTPQVMAIKSSTMGDMILAADLMNSRRTMSDTKERTVCSLE